LAKNYRNDSIVFVDMDKFTVYEGVPPYREALLHIQ